MLNLNNRLILAFKKLKLVYFNNFKIHKTFSINSTLFMVLYCILQYIVILLILQLHNAIDMKTTVNMYLFLSSLKFVSRTVFYTLKTIRYFIYKFKHNY